MSKYIVKNCPCIYKSYRSDYDCDYDGPCEDCTNCPTKQAIEKCTRAVKIADSEGLNGVYRRGLATEILKLFDIEECE